MPDFRWDPPCWVFMVLCPALTIATGYALFLVWSDAVGSVHANAFPATAAIGIALLLNELWSPIFYKYKRIGWAFVDSSFAVIFAFASAFLLRPVNETSMVIMLVYSAWYGFCAVLNLSYYNLNKPKKAIKSKRS